VNIHNRERKGVSWGKKDAFSFAYRLLLCHCAYVTKLLYNVTRRNRGCMTMCAGLPVSLTLNLSSDLCEIRS